MNDWRETITVDNIMMVLGLDDLDMIELTNGEITGDEELKALLMEKYNHELEFYFEEEL